MDGVFGIARSLEVRVLAFYNQVKELYDAFQARLRDAGDDVTELQLLRKEAELGKAKYDAANAKASETKDEEERKKYKDEAEDYYRFHWYKPRAAASSTGSSSAAVAADSCNDPDSEELSFLLSMHYGIAYCRDVKTGFELADTYKNKIMKAYCKANGWEMEYE
jgi:hypothetical protein